LLSFTLFLLKTALSGTMGEVSEGKSESHQQDDPSYQMEEDSLVSCSTNGEYIPAKDTEGKYWLHQLEEHWLHQLEEQHHQLDEVSLMTANNGEDTVAEGSDEATTENVEKDRENELNESEDAKQDTKEGEDEKKKNRLEAAGAWFQGLVGGGAAQQELRQRTNKDQKEDDDKDIENPEPLGETENPSSGDETPVDEFDDENTKKKGGLRHQISTLFANQKSSTETTKDGFAEVEENMKKKGGPLQQIGTLFANQKIVTETTKVGFVEDEENTKKKGSPLQQIGTLFANQKSVAETTKVGFVGDEENMKKKGGPLQQIGTLFGKQKSVSETTKDGFVEDEENTKKKGGLRQQISTFFGTKQRRVLLFAFMAVFFVVFILAPVSYAVCENAVSLLKSAAKVEYSLQAKMIKHPLYQGDLYPDGHITLR